MNWGKKFKTVKNAISRKNFFDLFVFTSFFAWTFLNFLAHTVSSEYTRAAVISAQNYKKKIVKLLNKQLNVDCCYQITIYLIVTWCTDEFVWELSPKKTPKNCPRHFPLIKWEQCGSYFLTVETWALRSACYTSIYLGSQNTHHYLPILYYIYMA